MKKLQKFKNDKPSLVCDNPECQSVIKIGDLTIKQIRPKVFGGDKYFHDRCRPR